MRYRKILAFLLVWTSLCLLAPLAEGAAAFHTGMQSALPGAEFWQPYLEQSAPELSQMAEDPLAVLKGFFSSALRTKLWTAVRGYAEVLLFLLLAAVLELLTGENGGQDLLDLVCACGCGVLLWGKLLSIAKELCAQIEEWKQFLLGFLPVYAGVLTMGGETMAGAAAGGFFLTLLCGLAQLLTTFVPPLLECYLALSMTCCICIELDLGTICKVGCALLQKSLSLAGKALAVLLGLQRVSAAQLDKASLRAGQFLTGTVPLVGQSLSEAAEAVFAGVQLLKSGLGTAALLILCAEFLPLYLGMLVHLGCLTGCRWLCSLTGNRRGEALLECFAEAVRCMMAGIVLFWGLGSTGIVLLFIMGGG